MKRINTSSSKIKVGFKGVVTSIDESVLGMDYAPRAFNFTFRDGVLKGDLGIARGAGYHPTSELIRHDFPTFSNGVTILDVFVYHRRTDGEYDDKLIVQVGTGHFYYTSIFQDDIWHGILGVNTTEKVSGVSYNYGGKDVFLLSSKSIGLLVYDGATATQVEDGPGFSSIAIHYERVFGAVNGRENQVWFSSVLDPTNWSVSGDTAGYVTFNDECGDVMSVQSLNGYLYIFREHGIYRLTAYGDQDEFSLKKVFIDTGRIYKDTIVPSGNKILFYTDEGVHSFDGYTVTKLGVELPKIFTPYTATAAYLENKYYLACKIDLGDSYGVVSTNNAILECDLKEKTLSVLSPYDTRRLVPMTVHHATDVLVVPNQGETERLGMIDTKGKIFEENTLKTYHSPMNTLGTDKLKIIREMVVETKYDLTVKVKVDDEEYAYSFVGANHPQRVFVDRSGMKIGFEISTNEAYAHLSPITVKIDTM